MYKNLEDEKLDNLLEQIYELLHEFVTETGLEYDGEEAYIMNNVEKDYSCEDMSRSLENAHFDLKMYLGK